ncbi:MAG: hypothetical protein ACFBQW_02615 [Sphingomonadaceae bacterium]
MSESPLTELGLGLLAGFGGTIAMTLIQKLEMRLDGRAPSTTPAEAVEKLADIEIEEEEEELRLANAVHLLYGTALGSLLIPLRRIDEPARTALFFATVWAGGSALLRLLDLSRLPHKWPRDQLAADLVHHLVYAGAASLLDQGARRLAARAD